MSYIVKGLGALPCCPPNSFVPMAPGTCDPSCQTSETITYGTMTPVGQDQATTTVLSPSVLNPQGGTLTNPGDWSAWFNSNWQTLAWAGGGLLLLMLLTRR